MTTRVQLTNDSSTVSKASMVASGYFHDPFIGCFSKGSRRSPLINLCYFIRVKAIDMSVRSFLQNTVGKKQILSLGAGFDSLYLRLSSEHLLQDTVFIEIDFPDVCRRKIEMLNSRINFGFEENADGYYQQDNYIIYPCDLTKLPKELPAFLQQDPTVPTLILSECVFNYIETCEVDALVRRLSQTFPNSHLLVYEQVMAFDGFGRVMRNHFDKLGSPLKTILNYPTIQDEQKRYRHLGWPEVLVADFNAICRHSIMADELKRVSTIEPFDEFEAFHAKCAHYVLVQAATNYASVFPLVEFGTWNHLDSETDVGTRLPVRNQPEIKLSANEKVPNWQTFGHTLCCFDTATWIVSGGFGSTSLDGKHRILHQLSLVRYDQRAGNLVATPLSTDANCTLAITNVVSLSDDNTNEPQAPPATQHIVNNILEQLCKYLTRTHHCSARLPDGSLLLMFGRLSPTKPMNDMVKLHIVMQDGECRIDRADIICSQVKPRYRCTASLDPAGIVYITGGITKNGVVLDEVLAFDASSNLIRLVARLPVGIHSCTTVVYDNSLFVCAGMKDGLATNQIWRIDLRSNDIEQCKVEGHFVPRYSHSSHMIGDVLLLVGGTHGIPNCGTVPGVGILNLQTMAVTELNISFPPEFPIILVNHQSILVMDEQRPKEVGIYIIGGGANCFSFGTHFNCTCFIKVPICM